MNTNQSLDRTAVSAIAFTVASLAIAWVASMPEASQKQAAAPAPVAVIAEEAPYKVVVTAQRLRRPVETVAGVAATTSQPRI